MPTNSPTQTQPQTDRQPKRTLSAATARRGLGLGAVGAAIAAVLTLTVSGPVDAPEKIVSVASEASPATVGPVSGTNFGAATAGDCLQWTPTDDPETDRQDIAQVSCADAHRFEVAQDIDLSAYPGAEFGARRPYPSADRFTQLRDEHCVAAVDNYLQAKFDPSGKYSVGLMFPSQAGWADGERTLRCGLQLSVSTGALAETTGSVRDQDQSNSWATGTCIGINGNVPTEPVDCAAAHAFEVASVVNLTSQFPGALPSVADQDSYLEQTCTDAANEYLGSADALRNKTLTLFWDNIGETSWLAGSRSVSCSMGKELDTGGFAPITGTAKGDILINGVAPVAPPPIADGRRAPTPLPGAAPLPG